MPNSVPEISLSVEKNPRAATIAAFDAAQLSICAVVYKFDDTKVLAALQAAQRRGVKIQVLLDEQEAKKNKSQGLHLAGAGAEVRTWPRVRGKLHAKFMIIDSRMVMTGSYNWTRSGGEHNIELQMHFVDQPSLGRFAEIFTDLWEQGIPLNGDL